MSVAKVKPNNLNIFGSKKRQRP